LIRSSEYTQAPKNIVLEGILSEEEKKESEMLEEFEESARPCPLESRNISVTPKDVLILAQFIKKDGTLLSQEQTGLSDR
jgi:ribosomal protein S18